MKQNSTIWIVISRFYDLWELGELMSELDELSQVGALNLTLTWTWTWTWTKLTLKGVMSMKG